MATTAAEINQALDQLDNLMAITEPKLDDYQAQLEDLLSDPAQPGAMDTYNNIVTERTETVNTWNSSTNYNTVVDLYNSAPQSVKDETIARIRAAKAKAQAIVNKGKAQKSDLLPKVKEAIEKAEAGETENEDDDQPGNEDATTDENNQTGEADDDQSSKDSAANNQVTAGSTNTGSGGTGQSTADPTSTPGRRVKNPLGYFSSYNYQITLYMITPDAYDAFILSGRKNIQALAQAGGTGASVATAAGAGAFIIAQSGGVNNKSSTRAPGFNFDYYIDNLRITTATNGKETTTATNVTDMSFTIVEPYGFSFITKLKNAAEALQQYSKDLKYKSLQNPSKQFFVLGIRFLGYDENGKLMTGQEQYNGLKLDAEASPAGLFERYYDILLTSIKFKIDGRATTYNIKAAAISPTVAFGIKRGFLNSNVKLQGATVYDALQGPEGLITKLNADQENLLNSNAIKETNNYSIKWMPGTEDLRKADIVLPEDLDKSKWATSAAKSTTDSNDAVSAKATPDNTQRTIQFNRDSPALQIISQVVSQSSYLRDALRTVYTSQTEPNVEKKSDNENKPDTKKVIRWYNLSAEVTNARWDTQAGDFAYDIKYVIQPYETPVFDSAYANPGVKYYGPHKRYDYWYTGKNSEILGYEQNLDNTYFNVVLNSSVSDTGVGSGGGTDVAQVPNRATSLDKQGTLDKGREAQNNYLTSLYDPGAYATAKINILGDPDFLAQESTSSLDTVYRKFYGSDGFTISPNGGQVFIEIDFKEAVDYDTQKGYLSINDSILFWKYPKDISKLVKGVSYMVKGVTSSFANGKFTQTLDCIINTFGDSGTSSQDEKARETPNAGSTAQGSNSTTQNTGLKSDPTTGSNKTNTSSQVNSNPNSAQPNTTPTNTGGVADDDGGP